MNSAWKVMYFLFYKIFQTENFSEVTFRAAVWVVCLFNCCDRSKKSSKNSWIHRNCVKKWQQFYSIKSYDICQFFNSITVKSKKFLLNKISGRKLNHNPVTLPTLSISYIAQMVRNNLGTSTMMIENRASLIGQPFEPMSVHSIFSRIWSRERPIDEKRVANGPWWNGERWRQMPLKQ